MSQQEKAELQQSGLRLLSGDASSHLGEHYFIAETTESDPKPLRAPPAPPEKPVVEATPQPAAEKLLLESQSLEPHRAGVAAGVSNGYAFWMAVQALHQELLKSQNGFNMLQKQLSMAEEQILQEKSAASSLRSQLQVAKAAAAASPATPAGPSLEMPKEKTPEISGSAQSTSLLFLQWQNAHLQAEIRHYQSALSSTKMELQILRPRRGEQRLGSSDGAATAVIMGVTPWGEFQGMQIMAGQLLESKHNLLQARVEHLELDLGFKVACGSTLHIEEASEPANSRPDCTELWHRSEKKEGKDAEAPQMSSLASLGLGRLNVPGLIGSTLGGSVSGAHGLPFSHLSGPSVSSLSSLGMPTFQQMSFSQMPGMSGLNIGSISGLQSGMPGMSGLGGAGMAGAPFGT
eukprot:s734_g15.t1